MNQYRHTGKRGSRDEIPPELQSALSSSAQAESAFALLPPSHRREYIEWITSARRSDTRERRAAQTVMRLLDTPASAELPEATQPE